jgi:anti-sigma-K factor RskA
MTCEELRDEYEAYSLGIVEGPERAGIAEHLARNCPACLSGVRRAMATVMAVSGTVPLVEPPKHLRNRVIGMVERENKRRVFVFVLPWAVSAAMVIILLGVVFSARQPNSDTAKLEQALAILNDPAAREVTFGETAQPSRGRLFVSGAKGVVLIVSSLPTIEANKTFQLWAIPAKGNPVPSGTFRGDANSTAVYVRPGPVQTDTAALALTVEPEGGSPQPTTTPFLVMKLSGT